MKPLRPDKTIPKPDWMLAPETVQLMNALDPDCQGLARFVGGCVRNTLLDLPVMDIDIATLLTPPETIQCLQQAGIKAIPTGIDYGTVTAIIQDTSFEITSLRKDVETDGRRAVVSFSKDWREDAARRDFTMNSLLADQEGHIYDPTGRGLKDLEGGHVIFVGDPAARIAEDYLRILRFFRFHAWYGKGAPDAAAVGACRQAADKISFLSIERVTQEWFKIVSADNPVDILECMRKNNILADLFDVEYNKNSMQSLCLLQKLYSQVSLLPRLLVLAGFKLQKLMEFKQKILFSKAVWNELQLLYKVLKLPHLCDEHAVKTALYKYGHKVVTQAFMIELVQGRIDAAFAAQAFALIHDWPIPKFPITGDILISQGFKPGPALGQALKDAEDAWIGRGFI